MSSLAHGIANFLDAVEILADTKHAVKVAALWGAWVESDKDGGTGDPGEDLKDLLRTAGETAELLDENGSWQSGEPTAEELGEVIGAEAFQGGGRLQEFGAGKRLQTLKNDNPGPNVVELLRWLVRDICTDVSMEILWDATRMSGPGMRFVMAELQRFISHQQEVNERDCQRVWMYLLAKDIQRGKLIVPPDVAASWYKVSWLAEKDMTIDRGRDGVLDLQLLEREKITDEEWWGRQGKDWKTEETKIYRQKLWREEMEKREREAFESRMRG